MIDMKPAVGRYLCKETIWVTGGTYRGGIITKISGKRIYFNCIYGTKGYEMSAVEEYVSKFAAICDTEEEYIMLQEHSKKCINEYLSMIDRHKEEFKSFFTKEN